MRNEGVTLQRILHPLEEIWEKTKKYSGINKDHYYSYYNRGKTATAIKFKNVYASKDTVKKKEFTHLEKIFQIIYKKFISRNCK